MDNVTKAFKQMHNQKRMNIAKQFGVSEVNEIQKGDTEFSDEQMEIVKALSSNNPFEVEYGKELLEKSDMSEIEKSDILDAVSCYGSENSFYIKKTGKEIKEQIKSVILPDKQAALTAKKIEVDKLLEECGDAPTSDLRPWFSCGMKLDVGYKIYDWEECEMKCDNGIYVSDAVDWEEGEKPKCNRPDSEEQCKARRCYNQAVEIFCRILVDIKTCELLLKNLSDNQNISLTMRQAITFQFD